MVYLRFGGEGYGYHFAGACLALAGFFKGPTRQMDLWPIGGCGRALYLERLGFGGQGVRRAGTIFLYTNGNADKSSDFLYNENRNADWFER